MNKQPRRRAAHDRVAMPGTTPAYHLGMSTSTTQPTTPNGSTQPALARTVDGAGARILAKSVYKQLKENGASRADIVSFTNTILELVTSEIAGDH